MKFMGEIITVGDIIDFVRLHWWWYMNAPLHLNTHCRCGRRVWMGHPYPRLGVLCRFCREKFYRRLKVELRRELLRAGQSTDL